MNKITHQDILEINDFLSKNPPKKNVRTIGIARIKKDGVIDLNGTPDGWIRNMTIATGREFAAQAVFKKYSPSSLFGNVTNYKVDGFGIGSGGSTESGGVITLLGPALGDKGLYTPIPINNSCLTALDDDGVSHDYIVKLIESTGAGGQAGSITFEVSNNIEFTGLPDDYYTVVKCSCFVDNTEPSYLVGGESVQISEAMLFFTSSTNTNPKPFAHICFAPKWLEKESTIEIEWFVLF
jgi:hypothetical protein